MVLLFWALFASKAIASTANFVRCDYNEDSGKCEYFYAPPPIESGPVIEALRSHYCLGKGHPLVLEHDEVFTPALVEEMRLRAEYNADGAIWVGAQSVWNDKTIFADMPYKYDAWVKSGVFIGMMDEHMAKLLDVHCANGKEPVGFYVGAADK